MNPAPAAFFGLSPTMLLGLGGVAILGSLYWWTRRETPETVPYYVPYYVPYNPRVPNLPLPPSVPSAPGGGYYDTMPAYPVLPNQPWSPGLVNYWRGDPPPSLRPQAIGVVQAAGNLASSVANLFGSIFSGPSEERTS